MTNVPQPYSPMIHSSLDDDSTGRVTSAPSRSTARYVSWDDVTVRSRSAATGSRSAKWKRPSMRCRTCKKPSSSYGTPTIRPPCSRSVSCPRATKAGRARASRRPSPRSCLDTRYRSSYASCRHCHASRVVKSTAIRSPRCHRSIVGPRRRCVTTTRQPPSRLRKRWCAPRGRRSSDTKPSSAIVTSSRSAVTACTRCNSSADCPVTAACGSNCATSLHCRRCGGRPRGSSMACRRLRRRSCRFPMQRITRSFRRSSGCGSPAAPRTGHARSTCRPTSACADHCIARRSQRPPRS